ncbi:hypothetical protein ACFW04_010477 [Cataglyphis niger]
MKRWRVKTKRTEIALVTLLGCLLFSYAYAQEDNGEYKGKYLGKLNPYHHQVSGDVWAVDQYTLLLTSFNYDGNGADTFFWAGASNRPGPQGFIVPDEWGKTNILDRYFNRDFTLTLPDNKKITDIKWFAVYDLQSQNTFGDVYIPEEFDPPAPQKISQLSKRSHNVSSEPIVILDSKTISIPQFIYDGQGADTYFWVGLGPQPSSKGQKVPDEYGYMNSLRTYNNEDIILELPGDMTVFNIDWLSVFDVKTKSNYGSVIIPDGLNVPPSLIKIIKQTQSLPNCVQLHKRYQVAWEIFGPQITIQLIGQVGKPSVGLAWYIEGALIPELYLRRGLTYNFRVYGGNNPHSANLYHPLIITDDPHGGYDTLSDLAQSKIRVLAGVELTRRGRPRPTADGGTLIVSPNSSWPDLVYYNSFTHPNMGWKIHVIDSYTRSNAIAYKLSLSFITIMTVFSYLL